MAARTEPQTNLTWHAGEISSIQRRRLLGQRGCVVWLTGLSGSGKSTLAAALERRLIRRGHLAYLLDGDNIRHGLNSDLGFSPADRAENVRRIGHVAALFADAGLIAIAALISPCRKSRAAARAAAGSPFFEVFCHAPLAVCEQRDPKGLYKKARAGLLPDFTGIDAPYQPPDAPELLLRTDKEGLRACLARLERLLVEHKIISPARRSRRSVR